MNQLELGATPVESALNLHTVVGQMRALSHSSSRFWGYFVPADEPIPYIVVDTTAGQSSDLENTIRRQELAALSPAYFAHLVDGSPRYWEVEEDSLGTELPRGDLQLPTGDREALKPTSIPDVRALSRVFEAAHNHMRDGDGLQPPEALDELLKFLFLVLHRERAGEPGLERRLLGPGVPESDRTHAQRLRGALVKAIAEHRSAGNGLHGLDPFALSTDTLCRVADELSGLEYPALPYDIKSTALRVFISSNMRRGLGVYLTPDPVVRMVVHALDPSPDSRILDPACGTGSFLLHTVFNWRENKLSGGSVWGAERNPRLLRVAELNLSPLIGRDFIHSLGDSLLPLDGGGYPEWFGRGSFDLIMTNPPFGVTVPKKVLKDSGFGVAAPSTGAGKVGSEIVFIERCLELLRPGGMLAIVVPNSVVSNIRLEAARLVIDSMARLVAIVGLPAETFATTGTQSTTSVLFFKRHPETTNAPPVDGQLYIVESKNVGYDNTGRSHDGADIHSIGVELRAFLAGDTSTPVELGRISDVTPGRELTDYVERTSATSTFAVGGSGRPLAECVLAMRTGRTPARKAYADEGHFIVKVGNLSGAGVDWTARDRNHVDTEYMRGLERSRVRDGLLLRKNDILLTSSAHAVRYIAKKVDLLDFIPADLAQPLTYVGELMLMRANPEVVDPYFLLAFLRTEWVRTELQQRVRGQTAHLRAKDIGDIPVPLGLMDSPRFQELITLLRKQSESVREAWERGRAIRGISQELFG